MHLDEVPPAPIGPPLLDGLTLALSLPDPDESRAIARYLTAAGARVGLGTPGGPFTGIRLIEAGAPERRVALIDMPVPANGAPRQGLPRPWRRDSLVRAVARAAGRVPMLSRGSDAPAAPQRIGGHVLVVDDNSVNRKILARQLELAGASTDTAAGGDEALELWRKRRYDLVLADLQMPGMDGFELARRMRQSEQADRRVRTPILAVTASALEEHEQRTRAVGMDGLLTKPIGIEQLRATLDVWLKDARMEQAT
jgi:CheY-like chemotaxis protein